MPCKHQWRCLVGSDFSDMLTRVVDQYIFLPFFFFFLQVLACFPSPSPFTHSSSGTAALEEEKSVYTEKR